MFKNIKSIGRLFFRFINCLIDYMVKVNKDIKFNADLLLIRIDAIGDFVIWQDSLRAFREKYKGKKVILICNKLVKSIAKLDPFFSDILDLDRRKFLFSPLYRFQFVRNLRAYLFKEVVSPVYSREYYYTDRLVYLSLSDNKIGYNGNLTNIKMKHKEKSDRWYTKLIDYKEDDPSELIINANFVQQLCNSEFKAGLPEFCLKMDNYLPMKEKYVVFAIASSSPKKNWDTVRFAELANEISDIYRIVLLGNGKTDRCLGEIFLNHSFDKTKIINLIDKTSVFEFIKIISHAIFVVGNDSAAIHIAAAVRVPSICIAPGGHYGRFVPYSDKIPEKYYHPRTVVRKMDCFGCNYRCIYPIQQRFECIKRIDVDEVRMVLKNLLYEI